TLGFHCPNFLCPRSLRQVIFPPQNSVLSTTPTPWCTTERRQKAKWSAGDVKVYDGASGHRADMLPSSCMRSTSIPRLEPINSKQPLNLIYPTTSGWARDTDKLTALPHIPGLPWESSC